jgi:Lsr2
VITHVLDDLDRSNVAETVSFGYRGTNYEIDLGRKNASAFDKMMKPYVDAVRKSPLRVAGVAASNGRRGSSAHSANELATIRKWARRKASSWAIEAAYLRASWMCATPLTNGLADDGYFKLQIAHQSQSTMMSAVWLVPLGSN